jgi:hypothetical protein
MKIRPQHAFPSKMSRQWFGDEQRTEATKQEEDRQISTETARCWEMHWKKESGLEKREWIGKGEW